MKYIKTYENFNISDIKNNPDSAEHKQSLKKIKINKV